MGRLVEFGLGTPSFNVVVIDCLLLVLTFGLATLLIDRRFWPVIVVGPLTVGTGMLLPERAPLLFGLYALVGLGTGVVLWGRSTQRVGARPGETASGERV